MRYVLFLGLWATTGAWGQDTGPQSRDGVPAGLSLPDVRQQMQTVAGVSDVHHVHIWAMSTTENALTAHLVLQPGLTPAAIRTLKNEVRHRLYHLNIQHATREVATAGDNCPDDTC